MLDRKIAKKHILSFCPRWLPTKQRCHKIEITWPFDFDARVVFRSADFVKYFVILSVNFEPLCIGLITSASTVKGDRKREIEQSPIKKKFRDSTISREDIDDAIANGIKLAFKEQQSTFDSVVTSAVRDAVDSVLIPALCILREDIQATNNSVKELREEFEAMAAAAKQTRDRVDSVQATAREDRSAVTDLRNQLERLTEKMTDRGIRAEEITYDWWGYQRGWRAPTWLVSSELIFSSGFLPWKVCNIEIDRAHRVMMEGKTWSAAYSHLPCAKMAWQIGDSERCSAGLSGWNARRTMSRYYFFLTLVHYSRQEKKLGSGFEVDDGAWSPALPRLSGGN